jgi:hypothetical protein
MELFSKVVGPGQLGSFDADTRTDEEKVILIMEEETRRTIEDNRKHDVADTKARRTEVVHRLLSISLAR